MFWLAYGSEGRVNVVLCDTWVDIGAQAEGQVKVCGKRSRHSKGPVEWTVAENERLFPTFYLLIYSRKRSIFYCKSAQRPRNKTELV